MTELFFGEHYYQLLSKLIQFISDLLNHIKCIALKVIKLDLHSCFSSGSGDIESGSYEENSPGN